MMNLVILRQWGFSFPPSKRKCLYALETFDVLCRYFWRVGDVLGSQADYLSQIILARMVSEDSVGSGGQTADPPGWEHSR